MLKKERTNVYDFNFHLVFVTKYRKQIFTTDELRNNMKTILLSIAENKEIEVSSIEVMSDHVHMLISFKPKYAPSSMVKSLKGTSAREWFKLHPETKSKLWGGHLWSPSFFMSTIGNVSENIVKQYIESQMQKSFKTKFG
ncbi:IS200/IS605 family transposase [Ligilactobacillus equi]|uniref:Transposase n=1 Tax=Ligilactobacillus equi DSM 15833 = JCM 10991 TaxID=1423740 RepID=A0A0R1TLK9_9LACO|nr:IS200/IS605 family transposase [Ligilactobacillus equi]KRL79429.1 transposase [Ligilactobacillus equi DSM 15833 = JCM 10991]